ncbi:18S rRNA maturation protein [Malassezia brasiliensis]|uniref:rRNA-processing protein EFG1 n=1 Tax=Malassezia brasiliensis TaxID=1821822 RepID=A0AAF0DYI4_9BASI|nr:18S rRNA maturation protein [Malassezia brasiliensis]
MKPQRTAHGKAPRRAPASTPAPASTGVNKVKNAIRQTKRLLARDSITPGTRIEAERRLVALQRELEEKEKAGKERNLAIRYHKVKFFERQKIHRRVRQLRREVEKDPKKKAMRAALYEARVLLHYVMTFPHDQRYVALFAQGNHDPVLPKVDAPDRAQQKAAEYLAHVRKQMKRGELSAEPEVELEAREEASRQARRTNGTKRSNAEDTSNPQAPKRRNVAQVEEEESEASDMSDASTSNDSESDRDTSDSPEAGSTVQENGSSEASSNSDSSGDDATSDESSSEESSSEEETAAPRNVRRARKPTASSAPSKLSLADDEFFAM